MSLWDRLVLALYGFVSLLGGVLVCAIVLQWLPWSTFMHYVDLIPFSGTPYSYLFWGGLLILIGISLFNLAIGRKDQSKTIEFRTEKGHVTIVLSAIEEYIRKTTSHMEQIRDIKSKVTAKGKGLKIVSKLVLNSDSNVTNLADTIQKEIEDKLIDMIGMDIPLTVNIHITKMAAEVKHGSSANQADGQAHAAAGEMEDSFRGIEY